MSIPKPSAIKRGFDKSWSISKGKMHRATDGKEEVLDELLGIARSYGVAIGEKDDGTKFQVFECEFEHSDGREVVSVFLTDSDDGSWSPSVHALRFLQGLNDMTDGELIHLTVTQSAEPKKKGYYPTYVNWSHARVDDNGNVKTKWFERRPESDIHHHEEAKAELDKLKARALYKDRTREKKDDGTPGGSALTHISLLCALCKDKGWPTPDQAREPWLATVNKKFKTGYAKMVQISEDEWGEVREVLGRTQKMPGSVSDWVSETGWAPDEAEEL